MTQRYRIHAERIGRSSYYEIIDAEPDRDGDIAVRRHLPDGRWEHTVCKPASLVPIPDTTFRRVYDNWGGTPIVGQPSLTLAESRALSSEPYVGIIECEGDNDGCITRIVAVHPPEE